MAKGAAAAIPAAISLGTSLMSKGGAAQPAAVDPAELAAAQGRSNITSAQAQAALNNTNTYSPWGSSVYTPGTDAFGNRSYSLTQRLSPELQSLYGGQVGLAQLLSGAGTGVAQGAGSLTDAGRRLLLGRVGEAAGAIPLGLDLSGVPTPASLTPGSFRTNVAQGPVQLAVGADFPALVRQAQNAAYRGQTQYLDPQFRQGESDLRQRLADQGIQEGSEAYSRAIGDFGRQRQQAYQSAQDQAVAAGNEQQRALFGESLSAGQFANAAQQQLFGQGLSLANLYNQAVLGAAGQGNTAAQIGLQRAQAAAGQPINALQALLAGGQGIYNTGLGSLGQAGNMVNLAPTWPTLIPTAGGAPAPVAATDYGRITGAATGQNQLANTALNENLGSLGRAIQQSRIFDKGGLFGEGGWASNLFGGGDAGDAGAFSLPSIGLPSFGAGMPFNLGAIGLGNFG